MTSEDRAPLECVAFMLFKDNHVLAEKRKLTKTLVPGRSPFQVVIWKMTSAPKTRCSVNSSKN